MGREKAAEKGAARAASHLIYAAGKQSEQLGTAQEELCVLGGQE